MTIYVYNLRAYLCKEGEIISLYFTISEDFV